MVWADYGPYTKGVLCRIFVLFFVAIPSVTLAASNQRFRFAKNYNRGNILKFSGA